MLTADLEKNTEFRIKCAKREMGSLPADSDAVYVDWTHMLRIRYKRV